MPLSVNDDLLAGRYELAELIGAGGMAEVYRAWDTRLRRPVAIKVFTADTDLANARRFDNEVLILAGLSHPGLVSVYDAGTSGSTPFVVLRLVDGPTLRHRMAEGPLPVAEVRSLGAAVADALAYVHDRDVVHRDVKPSNILLDDAGTPYLADFGLAHSVGSNRLTRTGLIVGTAAYLAPEQVRGAEVDSAADVYALGLVLLECLTGRCEYTGGDVEAIVARLHRSPVIPADLPADLARLLALMTAQSPGGRPSARYCADALRAGEVTAVSSVAPASWRGKALIGATAGLLGAIAITWATTSSNSTPPAADPPPAAVVVESTTTAPETAAQLAAVTTAPPATRQAADTTEPAPAPQVVQPGPAGPPANDPPAGPGKDVKPVPPGQAKKNKP